MIVLDTNVLSEILRPVPEPKVLAWLDSQPRSSLFTTTVTRGEIFYGIRVLPPGQRRQRLWDATVAIFNEDFAAVSWLAWWARNSTAGWRASNRRHAAHGRRGLAAIRDEGL